MRGGERGGGETSREQLGEDGERRGAVHVVRTMCCVLALHLSEGKLACSTVSYLRKKKGRPVVEEGRRTADGSEQTGG